MNYTFFRHAARFLTLCGMILCCFSLGGCTKGKSPDVPPNTDSSQTAPAFLPCADLTFSVDSLFCESGDSLSGKTKIDGASGTSETVYFFDRDGTGALPVFCATLTVHTQAYNRADTTRLPGTDFSLFVSTAQGGGLRAEEKNGTIVFTILPEQELLSPLALQIESDMQKTLATLPADACAQARAQIARLCAEPLAHIPWVHLQNTTFSTENFVLLNAPLDGGVVSVNMCKFFGTEDDFNQKSVPLPYSDFPLDGFTLNWQEHCDAVSGTLRSALQKEGKISFSAADLLGEPLPAHADAADSARSLCLNRKTVRFQKTADAHCFVIVFDFASFFGEYYSSRAIPVQVDPVSCRYTFDAMTDMPVSVRVFGQSATLTGTYRTRDETTDAGYTVSPKALPLFFTDRLSETTCLRYLINEQPIHPVPLSFIAPDEVRISVPDRDVITYRHHGIADAILSFRYGEDVYSTTLKEACNLPEQIPYADRLRHTLLEKTVTAAPSGQRICLFYADYHLPLPPDACASDTDPFAFSGCAMTFAQKTLTFDLQSKITPSLEEVTVAGSDALGAQYWEGDSLYIAPDARLCLCWTVRIDPRSCAQQRTQYIPLLACHLSAFDTSIPASDIPYTVVYEGKIYPQSFTYTVKENPVEQIEILPGSFDGLYVAHEPFVTEGCVLRATYRNGKTADVPITRDMVSGFDENHGGTQTLTVTYAGQSATRNITVKEVQCLSFPKGEQPAAQYCLHQMPAQIRILVQFAPQENGTAVITLTQDEIRPLLDTGTAGMNRTFSFTYGGKTITFDYNVYEAVYLYYTLGDTGATVCQMTLRAPDPGTRAWRMEDCTDVTIPAVLDGFPVTRIDTKAFFSQSGIRTILLPDTVQKIGDFAFSECPALQRIVLPAQADVGKTILYHSADSLREITLPDSENPLYTYFADTPKHTDEQVSIPAGLIVGFAEGTQTLTAGFFDRLKNHIGTLHLPASLRHIEEGVNLRAVDAFLSDSEQTPVIDGALYVAAGEKLFFYPRALQQRKLVIGKGVRSIGNIQDNPALEEVLIGSDVHELDEDAFSRCRALRKVTFLGTLKAVPDGAFGLCESLSDFTFPTGLERIGSGAFSYVAIENVRLPDTLKSIGAYAFYGSKIKRLYIPDALTSCFLGTNDDLFLTELEELVYDGSIRLTELNVYRTGDSLYPCKLKTIYLTREVCSRFGQNSGLSPGVTVYLAASVTKIGSQAQAYDKMPLYTERNSTDGFTYEHDGTYSGGADVRILLSRTHPYSHWWE